MAVVEHRAPFVTGEEVESLKRDSCSFPTPMAYERSERHRSSFYQLHLPPPHHAERALATHVEVTEGKYPQEKGHRLGFTPRAFRPGGLCCVLVPGWEEVSGLR